MDNVSIMFGTSTQEEDLFVAVDAWKWSLFKLMSGGRPPEIKTVIASTIEVLKSMFESVVMMLVQTRISL
jgi:hypothetical protein